MLSISAECKENVDILRELTDGEFQELIELYKNKYGSKNFHYLLMYNQNKWNIKLQQLNAVINTKNNKTNDDNKTRDEWIAFRKTFYTHRNCDFRKNVTYISLHMDLTQSISFNSWENDSKELFECLEKTKLIRWNIEPLLTNVDMQFCDEVKRIAISKGIKTIKARICQGFILYREDVSHLNPPNLPIGYAFRKIKSEDISLIHSLWGNNKEGSIEYVDKLAKINQNLAICREADNMLIGWIFQNDFAGIGIMHIVPEEQRKGFGSILVKSLCNEISKCEIVELSAWIVKDNFKSEGCFQKIGFTIQDINEWIQLKN